MITEILKAGFKLILFGILIAVLHFFVNFLMNMIPPLQLSGCIAHYFNVLGIAFGLRLFISIIAYAFAVRFALKFFSNYLN